jgi:DNA-binding LacI/PurR family transcriptional regulator
MSFFKEAGTAVKLTDIADKAGVSIATVSRVIRKGQSDNSPSCQKVLQVVKELGYEPNRIRKHKGIGNILFVTKGIYQEDDCEDSAYSFSSFYGLFLYSAEKEIRKFHGTLTVCHAEKNITDIGPWIRQAVRDSNCRGIIIQAGNFDRTSIDIFRKSAPVVLLNAVQGTLDLDSVCPDDEGGIRMVVNRLVELGHRRIAFWADWDSSGRVVDHCIMRLRGYRSGLEEAGLTYSRIYGEEVSDLSFSDRMERGFQTFLKDSERPTAIICCGDDFAYRVLGMAQKNGIKVPLDLSIFGFDDSDFSTHFHPQLSTVNIQRMWMSEEAVRLIVRRLSDDKDYPPCQVVIQAQIVERETSGPVTSI